MTPFPSKDTAQNGQLFAADNGAYYVYDTSKNQWQSTTVIPKWTDQVFVRGQDNVTQQNANDSAERAIQRSANQSVQAGQLLEVAIGVKSRGLWSHQGGVIAPGANGQGVAKTKFVMQRDPEEKVQAYEDATCFLISDEAIGTDNQVELSVTAPGDILTVQDNNDLEGGTYLITAVEEFGDYVKLKVVCHKNRTKGTASPDELVTIRVIKDHGIADEHFDHRYLRLEASNDVDTQFRIKGSGGTYISTAGSELGVYHLKTPTDGGHAANKAFVDSELEKVKAFVDSETEKVSATSRRIWTYYNDGTYELKPKGISYILKDDVPSLIVASKPASGPSIDIKDGHFGFRNWVVPFSVACETDDGGWRVILLGHTKKLRYSESSAKDKFFEVQLDADDLITNKPELLNHKRCIVSIAGLL